MADDKKEEKEVDLKSYATKKAIDAGEAVIVLVVAAAVTIAVLGGNLVQFVQALL